MRQEAGVELRDVEHLPVLHHNDVSLVQQPPHLYKDIDILPGDRLLSYNLLPHHFRLEQPLGRPPQDGVVLDDVVRARMGEAEFSDGYQVRKDITQLCARIFA